MRYEIQTEHAGIHGNPKKGATTRHCHIDRVRDTITTHKLSHTYHQQKGRGSGLKVSVLDSRAGGRLTSWLFTQSSRGVELGTTESKFR